MWRVKRREHAGSSISERNTHFRVKSDLATTHLVRGKGQTVSSWYTRHLRCFVACFQSSLSSDCRPDDLEKNIYDPEAQNYRRCLSSGDLPRSGYRRKADRKQDQSPNREDIQRA